MFRIAPEPAASASMRPWARWGTRRTLPPPPSSTPATSTTYWGSSSATASKWSWCWAEWAGNWRQTCPLSLFTPTRTLRRASDLIPRKNRPGPRFANAVLLILVFHLFNINSILITKAKLLQHEAKRKKFQNQDSVISEKFASKVKILIIQLILDKMLHILTIMPIHDFHFCTISGWDPRGPRRLNSLYFHQSAVTNDNLSLNYAGSYLGLMLVLQIFTTCVHC